MAHWGWYWKVKHKDHVRKRLCEYLFCFDSFAIFKNKELIKNYRTKVGLIPEYGLEITLVDNHFHIAFKDGSSYDIPIEKQACHFGGYRCFFYCPKCDKRMRKLYLDNGLFLCRKCADLCYFTQTLRPSKRCLTMANKIKEKLESMGGSLDKKPLWMKKKTFKALKEKYSEYRETKYQEEKIKELIEFH